MTKCVSQQAQARWEKPLRAIQAKGQMHEGVFQLDCLLSVLADIKREHVNMFELGAGYGRMCLHLAGAIDYKVIPIAPKSYRCLAVEGDLTHYQWIKEHFEIQNINGIAVHGAVSDRNGETRFIVPPDPASSYGPAIDPANYREHLNIETLRRLISSRKIPSMAALLGLIRTYRRNFKRKTTKTPMYTVDHLIHTYGFDHVDIVQMDVQSAEYMVMLGATKSIRNDLIDYVLIDTHKSELNDALRRLLSPKFDLIVDMYPRSVGTVAGFPPIGFHEGIQLYKRKNI